MTGPEQPEQRRVSPQEAIARQRALTRKTMVENPTLALTLAAMGEVQRGQREEVTLGRAEVAAVLNVLMDLRRDLGLAKARTDAGNVRKAELVELRAAVERYIAQGNELLGRLA